jgi:hypothetical protein
VNLAYCGISLSRTNCDSTRRGCRAGCSEPYSDQPAESKDGKHRMGSKKPCCVQRKAMMMGKFHSMVGWLLYLRIQSGGIITTM